jgi:hypothetical protein
VIDLRDLKTQAAVGGGAILIALVYVVQSQRPDAAPGSGGGPLIVSLTPEMQKRLDSAGRHNRHPREQGIIDRVQKTLGALPEEQRPAALRAMPKGPRFIWTTFWVEADVKNGGFDQYFLNGWGPFAADAAEGFRAMGVEAYARLVERALEIHRKETTDRSERNPAFEPLDHDFYNLDDDNPIERLRAQYIDAHPAEFAD